MKAGFRSMRTASCNLRQSALFDVPPPNLLELTNFQAFQQGKGHGTALMKQLCTEADMCGMNLMLMAESERLRDWYSGRFGFNVIQEEPLIMIRYAKRFTVSAEGMLSHV